jgi:uncharacterized protein (UPF0335 family)
MLRASAEGTMAERAKANRGKGRKANGKSAGRSPLRLTEEAWDEIYQRWGNRLIALFAELEPVTEQARTIKAQISQVYQAAEKDGARRKSLQKFMNDRKQPAEEIVEIERGRARLHAIFNTKAHQLDLFSGALLAEEPLTPYQRGKDDGAAGRACEPPFDYGSAQAEQYADGWNDGQQQNHDSLRQASAEATA